MVEAMLKIDLVLEKVTRIERLLEKKEERTQESRVTSKSMKLDFSITTLDQLAVMETMLVENQASHNFVVSKLKYSFIIH
jgi:hypothetical protein